MPGVRNVIHTDDELKIGSHYLRYHIRMYVETLLWLNEHPSSATWDTVRNAMLEDHLVHARILINFLSKGDAKDREDDVLAVDYFQGTPNIFHKSQDMSLQKQADDIGGYLVHITKKAMPKLKSEQEWLIRDTASKLVPAITMFLIIVSESKLADNVKTDCLSYLAKLTTPSIPVSLSAST